MSEKSRYPDKNVTKKELHTVWFPMSPATCERRLKEAKQIKKFKDIQLRVGSRVIVNVRGFFEFLQYRETQRFKV